MGNLEDPDFPEPTEPLEHLDSEESPADREAAERTELTEPPGPAAEVCPAEEEMMELMGTMARRDYEGPMEVRDYPDRTVPWETWVCPDLTDSPETEVPPDRQADQAPEGNLDLLDETEGTVWTGRREHQA